MISSVRIRAFRATDDREASHKFMEGHRKVLDIFGIEKVTSAGEEWGEYKNVFVILVDSPDGEKVYGGARVHAADGIHRLPIEDATGSMDPNIYKMVDQYAEQGCGELCGLWNSREVAGVGVGAIFATRAGVAITEKLGIKYLFALCAPYTVKFAEWLGGRIVTSLGKDGTFYYPKFDLLATALLTEDTHGLSTAHRTQKNRIMSLREEPEQLAVERIPGHEGSVEILYDLRLKNIDENEFKLKRNGSDQDKHKKEAPPISYIQLKEHK